MNDEEDTSEAPKDDPKVPDVDPRRLVEECARLDYESDKIKELLGLKKQVLEFKIYVAGLEALNKQLRIAATTVGDERAYRDARLNDLLETMYQMCPDFKKAGDLDQFDGFFLTFDELCRHFKRAWPMLDFSESPLELVGKLIDERDEAFEKGRDAAASIVERRGRDAQSREFQSFATNLAGEIRGLQTPGQEATDGKEEAPERVRGDDDRG